MADAQSTLQILLNLQDNATAALNQFGNESQSTFQTFMDNAAKAGAAFLAIGTPITAGVGYVVNAAENYQTVNTTLGQTLTNQISQANSSSTAHGALAIQMQFLTDKINGLKASNDKLAQTHEKTAADSAKADATIASNNISINKYQQQLDILTSSQDMAGQSASDLLKQFDNTAEGASNFGFGATESLNALKQLQMVTGNTTDTMAAFAAAQNLARALNEPLADATATLVQGMAGRGMQLKTIGVNVAEGVGGMQVISAVMQKVGGDAAAFNGTLQGQTDITQAKMEDLSTALGTDLIPMLTTLTIKINGVIDNVVAWTKAHPELVSNILKVAAVLGPVLVAIGSLLVLAPLVVSGFAAIATILGLVTGPFLAIAITVGIVAALIILHHQQIMDFIQKAWDWIKSAWAGIEAVFMGAGETIKNYWGAWIETLQTDWTNFWLDISKIANKNWSDITNAISTALNNIKSVWDGAWTDVSNFFQKIWNDMSSFVKTIIADIISAFKPLTDAINTVKTGLNDITPKTNAGASLNPFSSSFQLPHFASGGIVSSPTVAMIGEAGPEAVIPLSAFQGGSSLGGGIGTGGGGNIIVNVNGGTYMDQNAGRLFGNQIAKIINQQLKLRTI